MGSSGAHSRSQPHARGFIAGAALLSTLMVLAAPFIFAYFAPATVALWAAVTALSSSTPQLPQPQS